MTTNPFTERYSKLTNAELLEIISRADDYQQLAVQTAQEELDRRHLTDEQLADAKSVNEQKHQEETKHQEKIKAVEDKLKSISSSVYDAINPVRTKELTMDKWIKGICLLMGVSFLYMIVKDFALIKFIFTDNDSQWDFTTVLFILLYLFIPVTTILFWYRKKFGWILLAGYLSLSGCLSLYFSITGIFIKQWSTLFQPSTAINFGEIIFFFGGVVFLCRLAIRDIYGITKNLMLVSVGVPTVTNPSSSGGNQMYIAKYDASGNVLWAIAPTGGSTFDNCIGYSVALDGNNDIYVAGSFVSPTITFGGTVLINADITGTSSDIFLAKYDASGNAIWARSAGGGNLNNDWGYSVNTDINNNVFMVGAFQSPSITFGSFTINNAGPTDPFIVKYDAGGNPLWAKSGAGPGQLDGSLGVISDLNGNIYMTGQFIGGNISFGSQFLINTFPLTTDMFIVKYDPNGNVVWAKKAGGFDNDRGTDVCVSSTGDVYVTGISYSINMVFGSNTIASSASTTNTIDFIVKYDAATGNDFWAHGDPTKSDNSFGHGVVADQTGSVYQLGTYITLGISSHLFVVKYDAAGNTSCWVTAKMNIGAIFEDKYYRISADGLGNLYVAGDFGGSFQPDTGYFGNYSLVDSSLMSQDIFIAKFQCCTPNANVTGASTICIGQSATLTASGGSTYSWSNGSTNNSVIVSPTSTTSYGAVVTNANGFCSNIISVTINVDTLPVATLTGNTFICPGSNSTLSASGGINYSWNTGSTATTIIVSPSVNTSYSVTASNGCGSSNANILVNVSSGPPPTISGNNTLCTASTTTLMAGGGGTYVWSNGATTSSITVSAAGNYSVVVSTGTCSATATTSVTVVPSPVATVASDVTIAQGESVTLLAGGGGTYSWNTGETTSAITANPDQTTVYCVSISDVNNCTDIACAKVTVDAISCQMPLNIPNAFSPNGDGENDELCLQGILACIEEFNIQIYNEWGELVYESSDKSFCWDGTHHRMRENSAVFVFYIKAVLTDGDEVQKKGNISLLK